MLDHKKIEQTIVHLAKENGVTLDRKDMLDAHKGCYDIGSEGATSAEDELTDIPLEEVREFKMNLF